ncbi:HD domain-containing protein [Mycobacterium riyadhense]|uniref:HD domain-containing protein n=1 Tax=Mycobacterium riyadhense TaxID=486698 RepID=UPI001956BA72|nr:HD domain-containing protein [Mycobacterium riyadhense]
MALQLLSKSTYTSAAPVTTRRYSHTAGVAATAGRLARVLAPGHEEDIVTAAWLHDIGYSPDLVDTGFHPLDGARYAQQAGISPNVVSLIAHHTGAVVEARERGLHEQLAAFPLPADVAELAILSCADLCTGPDGVPIDPAERLAEVLQRYPTTDPVHRAITTSAPLLIAQARLVLAAAEAADTRRRGWTFLAALTMCRRGGSGVRCGRMSTTVSAPAGCHRRSAARRRRLPTASGSVWRAHRRCGIASRPNR